jgi:hypothetical protein
MTTHTETLDWSIERETTPGVYVETCYEITVEITPSTPDVWYLPNGDPGYPGDPGEIEILRIMQGKVEVPSRDWEAYGFTKEELERVEEAASQIEGDDRDCEERERD